MKFENIEIDNVVVSGLEESIKASKYPMSVNIDVLNSDITKTVTSLAQSGKGEGHDQFLTGINVSFDVKFSLKAWTEAERYRFLYFVSSQSTMHRISRFDVKTQCNKYVDKCILRRFEEIKQDYLDEPDDSPNKDKKYLKLLYNIPSGFMLTARLTTNYRQLKTIYTQRKNHRLPEWHEFCSWIETLPHSEFIVGKQKTEEEITLEQMTAKFKQKLQKLSKEEQEKYLDEIGLEY